MHNKNRMAMLPLKHHGLEKYTKDRTDKTIGSSDCLDECNDFTSTVSEGKT